jgi:hypothetical protein
VRDYKYSDFHLGCYLIFYQLCTLTASLVEMFSILTLAFILIRAVYAQWPAPEPCSGFCHSHDPSLIKHENGTYFRFSSGNTVATSPSLTGPWVHEPDALVGASAGVGFLSSQTT